MGRRADLSHLLEIRVLVLLEELFSPSPRSAAAGPHKDAAVEDPLREGRSGQGEVKDGRQDEGEETAEGASDEGDQCTETRYEGGSDGQSQRGSSPEEVQEKCCTGAGATAGSLTFATPSLHSHSFLNHVLAFTFASTISFMGCIMIGRANVSAT
ncbi:hypothetical protein ACLOJK_037768 [Asimina triloba]